MTIEKAKQILGEKYQAMNDESVEVLLISLRNTAKIAVKNYIQNKKSKKVYNQK